MKKLTLDLDALVVETFDTAAKKGRMGTVRGQDISDSTCYDFNCACQTFRTCETDCGTCYTDCDCPDTGIPQCSGVHTCNTPSCLHTSPCACP